MRVPVDSDCVRVIRWEYGKISVFVGLCPAADNTYVGHFLERNPETNQYEIQLRPPHILYQHPAQWMAIASELAKENIKLAFEPPANLGHPPRQSQLTES